MPTSLSIPDPTAMAEALHLTKSGRLAEATAMIQRALSGAPIDAEPTTYQVHQLPDDAVVIEGETVDDEVPRADCSARLRTGHARRSSAVPPPPTCRARSPRTHAVPNLGSLPGLGSLPDLASLPDLSGLPGLGSLPDLGSLPGLGGGAGASTSRPYRLHVPADLPPGPRPLVVLLHGGTQDAASFADATGFDALADEHGFIALYPEQITAANPMRYWNWFNRSDQQRDVGEPAILVGLVKEIAAEHDIDESRVFVAGFSAGAAMSSVLGATYPDVFAGIGVHSGLAHGAATDMISAFSAMRQAPATAPAGALPTIVIHGDADPTVDVSNAAGVLEQFAPAGALRRTHQEKVGGREVERTLVERDGRVVAERLVIHGAGHTWSGGRAGGSYADPSGPDAAAEIVRFFGLIDRERSEN
ncbi:extracellular catalytic domain type 1 short-chain-length polyhydroxyalkanoate depolymerase [Granulicoccus sp. GXG6511]|uniref:extracellular catalytic domain type 1 short-chain-length polyhydroxyalkanoate depolymerase n=1 Tax=Granulicoccus sp. GXG6511 TaxID=3381351 RepID=UPI003D7CCAE7